jgi:hypothetical protein
MLQLQCASNSLIPKKTLKVLLSVTALAFFSKISHEYPKDYNKSFHSTTFQFNNLYCSVVYYGARGSVVVKALCYKPEGRGFDSR